jgi:hypothetical protein
MAKRGRRKGGVNKTQVIKDMLAADPSASPKVVSADLATKGIKASPTYVSSIKSKLKGSHGRKRKGKKRRARDKGDAISIEALVEAKRFADKLGGVGKVKAIFDALAKLN